MGSYKELYDEMKSKYGDPNTDQSQGGNYSGSKYRKLYDEMKSKYGDPNTDQVETKAEETQDVVNGKPILEFVERDNGIFSMEAPKKKQTAPEETPAPVQQSAPKSEDEWQKLYDNSTSEMERLEKEWQELTDKMSGGMPSAEDQQRLDELQKQYKEAVTNRDAADNQLKQIGNNEVMRADLEILASWPEEDRNMLIQYALNDHKGRSVFERSSESATRAATALVELQKKYDKDTIKRLSESYQWYQNEIATKTMQNEAAKEVQGKPGAAIVHSALTLPATVAGTVTAPLDYLGQVFGRTGRYSTLDPNARGNLPNVYSGAVRQQVASDIAGDGSSVGRKAASYLYQGGMSALDTGARLLASGGNPTLAATLAGLGTFGQTVSQASAQGATPAQAIAYGTAAAGIEALTEKLPLDELVKTAKGWHGPAHAIKEVFKQAGIEVSEEEIGLIASTLAEMAILQEKASTNQRIQQLVTENGMSVAEANNQVMYELLGEAMDTAVVSAISGGLSSAGGSVVAYAGRDTGGAQTAQEGAEAAQSQESKTEAVTPDTAAKQQQTQAEEPQSNVQKAVQEFRDTGKVSNRMAEVILNDAESVAALQKETGMELPDTASGRRNAVKDAVAQLIRNEDAKDLTSSTAEALLRKQEQPQEAKAEDPEENRRLAIEATRELQGLPKQETVENVDTSLNGQYNNDIKDGGNYYAGNQNDRTAGTGNSAQGMAGVRQGYGYGDRGGRQPSGVAANSGILRVSTHLRNAFANRKHAGYELYDTTALPEAYERALAAGRDSDPENGWCVTPKSAQELTEGSVRTFMNDNGTVGVGVAADGDIVAVFKNKNGGPKKALDTAMPAAIDMGGDRLDCYGEGLVKVYEDYGFIPVARVEFNPEYANPGWTPDKKTPYIYFMMHNGDSSAEVVEKMHRYPHKTKAELEALPTYGRDDYDVAMEYRNGLMDQRSADMDHGAVGAAERNFSGKQAFNELLSEENAQPDRPGDVRPMEIPKKDAYGRRVSETAANLYGAEVTPDTMADTIQELVGIGALGFDTRSNDQSLKAAAASITKTGWKATEKQITNRVANGKLQDGDIEKALLLYSAYANKDDQASQDMAAELVVDLATMANMTGRNLQLFKLIRKLTPQGQLMATQKTVQRYVDQLNKKRSKNDQIEIDISQELKDDYLTAAKNDIEKPTQETARKKAEIEQAIYLSAASQIKATFAEKWNAWRYMCMLGNVKTNVRNIGGNIAQIPYTEAKRIIGAAFEKALPKEQRTKAVLGLSENDRALKEWAAADAKTETVNDALKYSAKLGDDLTSSKISDARRIFDKDVVEKARKLVSDIPAGADMFFKNIEYTKSLAGFVKARGYTYADIESGKVSEAVLNEGRAYAIQEAMKATFNDANAFSDFVSNLRYKGNNPAGKALNALGEGILPFRRTPANVAVRMVENSPANIARSVWNMATKVKNGDMSASTAIDQMAAGLTGTGAMMLGALLASGFAGFRLLGSDVDEDEKRLGHQKYSIEFSINGQEYSYTVDWAAPAAIPLFVGANVYDLWQSRNEDTGLSAFTSAVYAGINMLEPMLSLACLSSLQDAIESVKYAEEGTALYALVANAATSYFTQGIPSLLRQASQAIPENKQQTFANSADPLIRDLQKTVANIPFAGYAFKTDKVDEWGEKEDAGNVVARVFNAFFNPGTLKAIDNSDLEAEINRLNKAQPESITPPEASKKISYTDKNGKYHDGYRLTEEEYTKLRQVQGQTAYEILQKVISSSDYKALTDEQKANVFSHVYSYASERARVNAISDYGGFSKAWMMNIRGKEADTIIRKVALGDISESVSALNEALDENWDTAEAAQNMETAWKAYSGLSSGAQAKIRKEAGESAAGKYIAAREAGVANEEYVTVLKNVAGLKPQGGYKNVREIQQAQAVGKMSGLSNAEKEAMIRGYVSDGQDKNIDDMKELFRDNNRSFSVNDYLEAWAISDKESGKGEKGRIIAEYRKRFNLDEATAEELYKIFK